MYLMTDTLVVLSTHEVTTAPSPMGTNSTTAAGRCRDGFLRPPLTREWARRCVLGSEHEALHVPIISSLLPLHRSPEFNMPVLLWSFPGSGNTYGRQLIEMVSGRATGSLYHDRELAQYFSAEMRPVTTEAGCRGLSAVKIHGTRYEAPWTDMLCGSSAVVSRAIFLIRHPFRAVLAEYERAIAYHEEFIVKPEARKKLERKQSNDRRHEWRMRQASARAARSRAQLPPQRGGTAGRLRRAVNRTHKPARAETTATGQAESRQQHTTAARQPPKGEANVEVSHSTTHASIHNVTHSSLNGGWLRRSVEQVHGCLLPPMCD